MKISHNSISLSILLLYFCINCPFSQFCCYLFFCLILLIMGMRGTEQSLLTPIHSLLWWHHYIYIDLYNLEWIGYSSLSLFFDIITIVSLLIAFLCSHNLLFSLFFFFFFSSLCWYIVLWCGTKHPGMNPFQQHVKRFCFYSFEDPLYIIYDTRLHTRSIINVAKQLIDIFLTDNMTI